MKTASLINHLMNNAKAVQAEVGMGATVTHWTDRTACTVIEVTPKKIVVQADLAVRVDNHGMSDCQSYEYSRDQQGERFTFTLRKNGKWVMKGCTLSSSCGLLLGARRQYHDYCF